MAKAPKKTAAKAAAKTAQKAAPIVVVRTGEVKEIDFVKGMTVGAALERAGYSFKAAEEVRVNNKRTKDAKLELQPGDQLMIIGAIAGA